MKPKDGDYAPYYNSYIDFYEDENILQVLEDQVKSSELFFKNVTEEQENYSYAKDKWTVKEVLGHMIDVERIMAFRALSFARGEKQSLPGFEQDNYVAEADFSNRTLSDLFDEFRAVRKSNIILFKSFDEKVLNRRGNANGVDVTVLALVYIVAGHEKHHIQILKERYIQ